MWKMGLIPAAGAGGFPRRIVSTGSCGTGSKKTEWILYRAFFQLLAFQNFTFRCKISGIFCTREDKLGFLTINGLISLFLLVTLEYSSIAEILALRKPLMHPANHSVPEKLQCGILGAAVPVICCPCVTWRQLDLSKCGNNFHFNLHHVRTSGCPSETSKCSCT